MTCCAASAAAVICSLMGRRGPVWSDSASFGIIVASMSESKATVPTSNGTQPWAASTLEYSVSSALRRVSLSSCAASVFLAGSNLSTIWRSPSFQSPAALITASPLPGETAPLCWAAWYGSCGTLGAGVVWTGVAGLSLPTGTGPPPAVAGCGSPAAGCPAVGGLISVGGCSPGRPTGLPAGAPFFFSGSQPSSGLDAVCVMRTMTAPLLTARAHAIIRRAL